MCYYSGGKRCSITVHSFRSSPHTTATFVDMEEDYVMVHDTRKFISQPHTTVPASTCNAGSTSLLHIQSHDDEEFPPPD